MTDKVKRYCEGLDCAICDEKEPCIYKIANELEEKLQAKEQECKGLEEEKLDRQNALTEMINILYPNADDDELFNAVFNSEYIDQLKEVVEQLKSKEKECERWKEYFETAKEASNCNLKALGEMTEWADQLEKENDKLKQVLSEIKGNAYCIMNDDEDEGSCYDRAREIVDKIDEVLND